MIRAVIIDDENGCVETLSILLRMHCPEITIEAACTSGASGIEAILKYKPDVVFLDIEMPVMNGFELLEKIGKISFQVVFTTAYNQFAIKAFKYSALDYLLKPIDPDDLKAAVARIKELKTVPMKEQFEILLQNVQENKRPQRIALSTGDGLVFVNTADIMYCQSDSNYTNVVLVNGDKYLLAKSLKEFEDTLPARDFFRIHNSFLVNMNQVKKFVRGDGGYVIMNDETQITIARARREEFFALFDKF